jgi:hypothetical protein
MKLRKKMKRKKTPRKLGHKTAGEAYRRLRQLRGKVKFSIKLTTLRNTD